MLIGRNDDTRKINSTANDLKRFKIRSTQLTYRFAMLREFLTSKPQERIVRAVKVFLYYLKSI